MRDTNYRRMLVAMDAAGNEPKGEAEEAISDLYRIANEMEHWANSDRDLATLRKTMRTYASCIRKRAEVLEGKP